jgi:crotonobetainyl-CoA:carnitine CoA-transferase CaiB-like acyl-CoA transferase
MFQPLAGVRVIDMSHVIAGPLSSFYLAQLGAEVIKVEPPGNGDVMRAGRNAAEGDTPDGFVALNAGKRSLAADIRTDAGADTIRALARTADVFIENFRPGVVARYGLDYESIKEQRPDIIYCSISGYGQEGEWAQRGAYDHVVQALTGMMMMSGAGEDVEPIKVGFPVVDVAIGVLASLAITAALHGRQRDGQGRHIDASMVQASLTLMYPQASTFLSSGVEPQRLGNRGYSGSPTADTYRCADGWLATAANTPAQFRKLTAILGLEHLCHDDRALDLQAFNSDGGFVIARDMPYLREQFRQAFVGRSAAEMEARLNAAGVPAARVRKLGEFLREIDGGAQVQLPGLAFEQNGRRVRTAGLGFRYLGDTAAPRPGAESLGQSNAALAAEARRAALDANAGKETHVQRTCAGEEP